MTVYVILGFALVRNKIHPILQKRLDLFLKKYKKGDKIILSGGKNKHNEKHTQAFAMKKYIKNHTNIENKDILLENRSKTTIENIFNTFKLLDEFGGSTITIITSSWHLKRVKMITDFFCERKMKIAFLGARKITPTNSIEEKLIKLEKKYIQEFQLFSQKHSQ